MPAGIVRRARMGHRGHDGVVENDMKSRVYNIKKGQVKLEGICMRINGAGRVGGVNA